MYEHRASETFRAYAADFGRVAYLSLCAVIAATLILEMIAPGVAGNVVSPQRLTAAAILAAALTFLAPPQADRGGWRVAAYVATAVALTVIVFSSALGYFASMPPAFAAAACAALPFLAYAPADKK